MQLTIQDSSNQAWPVKVDFKAASWDASGAKGSGSPFPLFTSGKVVRDAGGNLRLVTALWDLLLIAAPQSEADKGRTAGDISVTNCRTGPWDRGPLRWTTGAAAATPADTGPEKIKDSKLLPARTGNVRTDICAAVRALMPCCLGDDKWDVIQPGSKKQVEGGTYYKTGTSCVVLPGWVTSYAGSVPHGMQFKGTKRVDEVAAYQKRRSLSGTTTGRTKGRVDGSWIKADGTRLPREGDIYCLLDRNEKGQQLTNKDTDYIAHIGVVLKATQTHWETADLGQGSGWSGAIVRREYHAGIGELFGETLQNKPGMTKFRIVAGWVDVERYFPDYSRLVAV